MSLEHQDWKPVVLKKAQKTTQMVHHQAEHKKKQNLNSDDPDAPKTLGLNAGKQIQQARCEKKLSQKQLAQKINVKPVIIQSYEQGKVVPDRAILNKLNKTLNIRIQIEK